MNRIKDDLKKLRNGRKIEDVEDVEDREGWRALVEEAKPLNGKKKG